MMVRAAIVALLLMPFFVAPAVAATTLEIHKVDQAKKAIPGSCFQVYDDAGGGARGPYRNARCDGDDGADDGTVTIANLDPGKYVLEEIRPPVGYAKGADTPVTIGDGPTAEIEVINQPLAAPSAAPSAAPQPTATATATTAATASPAVIASPQGTPGATAAVPGLVDIGGRSLFMTCAGAGGPTVLLEAGGPGFFSTRWAEIQAEISTVTRVCSYDRAGLGLSDPGPDRVRSAQDSVNDLRALIDAAAIECPCIFAGESWGGVILRLFASQYPTDIAGLVFVDEIPPGFIAQFSTLVAADEPLSQQLLGSENPERMDQLRSLQQADAALPPPPIPAVVITHGLQLGFPSNFPVEQLEAAWREAQAAHAASLHARLVVAGQSGSDVIGDQPEVVIGALNLVTAAVRDPASVVSALQVHTDDPSGRPLPGSCFQVYLDGGGGTRGEYKGAACDDNDGAADGTVTIPQLPAGAYLVQQVTAPPGYQLATADATTTVAGLATDLTLVNQPVAATPQPASPTADATTDTAPTTTATTETGPTATTTTEATTGPSEPTSTPTAAPTPELTIVDLGTLGGATSDGYAVNAAGQAVGVSDTEEVARHGFVWQDGDMISVETLGGPESRAYDINDAGQVIGVSQTDTEEWRGFLWEDDVLTNLGTLGGNESRAFAINAAGQVVGVSRTADGVNRAFVWEEGPMTDLGTLGGETSAASAINARGQIVGPADTADGERHAYLWQNGTMADLGTLGGANSRATDINDNGIVVGVSEMEDGSEHAFVWDGNKMTDVGALGTGSSEAWAINRDEQIVGEFNVEGDLGPCGGGDGTRAFFWQDGTMIDLNDLLPPDSGWVLQKAREITDRGEVVGLGVHDGECRAYLLTLPADVEVGHAPVDPSGSALVRLGAVAFGRAPSLRIDRRHSRG